MLIIIVSVCSVRNSTGLKVMAPVSNVSVDVVALVMLAIVIYVSVVLSDLSYLIITIRDVH